MLFIAEVNEFLLKYLGINKLQVRLRSSFTKIFYHSLLSTLLPNFGIVFKYS